MKMDARHNHKMELIEIDPIEVEIVEDNFCESKFRFLVTDLEGNLFVVCLYITKDRDRCFETSDARIQNIVVPIIRKTEKSDV